MTNTAVASANVTGTIQGKRYYELARVTLLDLANKGYAVEADCARVGWRTWSLHVRVYEPLGSANYRAVVDHLRLVFGC